MLAEELVTNKDGGMIRTRITKETNLFIKPQNVEDNERRCSSCKSRKFVSVVKKHVWSQRQDTLPFSLWFPKLIELFKQKSRFLEYIYSHVCDYNLNRMTIEANTENILKRQDEILAKINELKHPITVIPPNINGMFIRGHHIKLRYVVAIVAIILMWAVAASVSSLKYKEESFAHYSMYRAVKEQHQHLIEKAGIRLTENLE